MVFVPFKINFCVNKPSSLFWESTLNNSVGSLRRLKSKRKVNTTANGLVYCFVASLNELMKQEEGQDRHVFVTFTAFTPVDEAALNHGTDAVISMKTNECFHRRESPTRYERRSSLDLLSRCDLVVRPLTARFRR